MLSGLTATGTLVGTPAYMAPEQWSGDAVTPATDQFAYCVALWEALTGELLAFLDGRIAAFKRPRTIDYVAQLPRDPNGKLYKSKLRDPYWAGRDSTI